MDPLRGGKEGLTAMLSNGLADADIGGEIMEVDNDIGVTPPPEPVLCSVALFRDEEDEDEGEEVMWQVGVWQRMQSGQQRSNSMQDIAVGDGDADEAADEGEEEEDVGG